MKRRSRGKTSKTKRQRAVTPIVPAFPPGVAATLPPHWFEQTAAELDTVKDLQNFCIAIASHQSNYCNDDRFWKQVFRIRYPNGLKDRYGRNVLSSDAIAQSGLLLLPPHPGRLFWKDNYFALLGCTDRYCLMTTTLLFKLSRPINTGDPADIAFLNAEAHGRRDELLAHLPWSRNRTGYWQLDPEFTSPRSLDSTSWFRAFAPGRAMILCTTQEWVLRIGEDELPIQWAQVKIYTQVAIQVPQVAIKIPHVAIRGPRREIQGSFVFWGEPSYPDSWRYKPRIEYHHLVPGGDAAGGTDNEELVVKIKPVGATGPNLQFDRDELSEAEVWYPTGPDPPAVLMQDTQPPW